MNIKKLERDFLSANAKTATSVMNATGWKEGIVNAELVNVDSVFLYAFDHQTDWLWCCSVPRDSFFEVVGKSNALDPDERGGLPGLVCEIISRGVAGKLKEPVQENELAIALSAYTSITRSYQLTENATLANHFVVIRYGATNMIRPFASMGPARHLLIAEEIQDKIKQVVAIDSKNHPEWISKKSANRPR